MERLCGIFRTTSNRTGHWKQSSSAKDSMYAIYQKAQMGIGRRNLSMHASQSCHTRFAGVQAGISFTSLFLA